MSQSLQAEAVVDGTARGTVLVLGEPLSFWGGVDPATGVIVDRHHPQAGTSMTGTVLVLPGTRGSAGGSGSLAECLRLGTGPAAIVLPSANRSVVIGVLVADELYGRPVPVLVVPGDAHASFRTGEVVTIAAGGRLRGLCAAAVVVGCDANHRATGGTHVRRTDTT